MAEKMRVHTLAKELGVNSKAILVKCQAEGLDQIKNHMSTLSIGLSATIREWFSEGSHSTVVETSERVDLEKVRKAVKKRTRKKKAKEAVTSAGDEAVVAVEERPIDGDGKVEEGAGVSVAVAEAAPVGAEAEKAEAGQEAVGVEAGGVVEIAIEPASAEGVGVEEPPAGEAEAGDEQTSSGLDAAATAEPDPETKQAEGVEPEEPVGPAGPVNVPVPAQLQGPRVIRVTRPDEITPPGTYSSRGVPPPRRREPAGVERTFINGPEPAEKVRGGRKKPGVGGRKETARPRTNPRRSAARGSDAGERLREWRERDIIEREERLRAASGRGLHARRVHDSQAGVQAEGIRKGKIQLSEPVMLNDFSAASGIRTTELMKKLLFEHKIQATKNMVLERETAEVLALDFGIDLEIVEPKSALDVLEEEFAQRERNNAQPRAPVVAFLGHVDHGKTSLLDSIRKTRVTESEAGGITQHIGAYRLDRNGLSVTFLDTPGHEAFTAMRARGANMTDVVVLVVAADDGVMTQTVEAINHAKAAGVTIVVALNKIDLPGTDPDRVLGQLAEHELVPTAWGGDVDVIRTSAVTGEGIDELVQHLATLSELLELKADATVPATGVVVEAEMKEGVGVVARVLVREGTLKNGGVIVCGPSFGRVRSMSDDLGRRVQSAGPATPIELTGLNELPDAGDAFYQVKDLQRAKDLGKEIRDQRRAKALASTRKPKSLEDLFSERELGDIPRVNVILKADTQGSIDALTQSLGELPSDQVRLNILHSGAGGINEGDIVLAEASGAFVIGFHVVPESGVQRIADEKGVDVRMYRVIYELIDEIKQALEGKLVPEERLEIRGRADIREIFNISRVGTVAGCYVTDGVISRNHRVRVLRDSVVIRDNNELENLKRFKDDAREVRSGMECGLKIAGFDDIKPGDVIESYEVVKVKRKL